MMSLSCSCDFDYDFDAGDKAYAQADPDFQPFIGIRRKRCCSCRKLIEHRSPCLEHPMMRYPYTDMEARFNGALNVEDALCDEPLIPCASHFHCERCGEIWLNLQAVGYNCLSPGENMEDALKEYHAMTGFKPIKKAS